jgi:hypothetical protein
MAKITHSSGTLHTGARSTRAPVVLSRRATLFVSAGVVAHTLWTSAAPAMVYGLYAEEWLAISLRGDAPRSLSP